MNGANQNQPQPATKNPSPVQGATQSRAGSPVHDPQKLKADAQNLDSVIRANRLKLDQGWQELQKLDQTLVALDARLKSKREASKSRQPIISKAA
jgi:hypothetical protein